MTSSEVAVERATKMLTASWRLSSRPCDSCSSSASIVFCRVDSAFLCLRCDSKIHGASTAHARVWVCEVCEQAPAAVTCRADAAALCGTCDADIHSANPLSRRHDRVPIVPFHETPSTVRSVNPLFDDPVSGGGHPCGVEEEAEAASWLLLDPNPKVSEAADVGSKEFCFSDPYADLEYPCLNDSVVPVRIKSFQVQQAFVPSSAENCVVELDFRRSKATATTYGAYATAPSLTQSIQPACGFFKWVDGKMELVPKLLDRIDVLEMELKTASRKEKYYLRVLLWTWAGIVLLLFICYLLIAWFPVDGLELP